MTQMKKDTFFQKAKEKIKNKGLVYSSALVIAGCTGLVFLAKDCNGPGAIRQAAPLCEPVLNDNRCCEAESYPYERNPDGTVKMENGQPVVNRLYDFASCHDGDGRCQNATKLGDLRDAADRPVASLPERFLDGRAIALPLETETSQDCVMQAVRDNPCAPLDAQNPQTINRQRMTGTHVLHTLRQRSQEEIEQMHVHPEMLRSGDNYFVVINNYEETCDATLPVCTPDMVTACFCANHVECAPSPCGNGRIDQGERCDASANPTGCGSGTVCRGCSKCATVQRCGNGRIDQGERCDATASPTGCGANQTCAPGCRTCTGGETHSICRDEQCVSVPGRGSNACSTDDDCASAPPPPPPPPVTECPGEVVGRFTNRISSSLSADPLLSRARSASGRQSSDQSVTARVTFRVEGGTARITGISLTCAGCSGGSLPEGSINLAGIPPGTNGPCNASVRFNLPPG